MRMTTSGTEPLNARTTRSAETPRSRAEAQSPEAGAFYEGLGCQASSANDTLIEAAEQALPNSRARAGGRSTFRRLWTVPRAGASPSGAIGSHTASIRGDPIGDRTPETSFVKPERERSLYNSVHHEMNPRAFERSHQLADQRLSRDRITPVSGSPLQERPLRRCTATTRSGVCVRVFFRSDRTSSTSSSRDYLANPTNVVCAKRVDDVADH